MPSVVAQAQSLEEGHTGHTTGRGVCCAHLSQPLSRDIGIVTDQLGMDELRFVETYYHRDANDIVQDKNNMQRSAKRHLLITRDSVCVDLLNSTKLLMNSATCVATLTLDARSLLSATRILISPRGIF